MIITHKLRMDLTHPGASPRISVVQGDACCRNLAIFLYADKRPWKIPSDASAVIRYRRPNGDSGCYDTLANSADAVSVSGNCVSILLAPEVLQQAGLATIMVSIISGIRQLTTFAVELQVQPVCGADEAAAPGSAWVSAFLPSPAGAAVGQYFAVETVDAQGRVLTLKAVDAPTGSQEEIRAAVEEYLKNYDFSGESISLTHSWEGTVLTVTSASGTSSADLKGEKGEKGATGATGAAGVSPSVTVTEIDGGHRVTITDASGTKAFDVMDGENGNAASVTVDSVLSTTSENPVQNKVVTREINYFLQTLDETIMPQLLPEVNANDNGKFLQVADGAWKAVAMDAWAGGEY